MEKIYVKKSKEIGCESFKISSVSPKLTSLIEQMNLFAIDRLNKTPNISNSKGMSISIESPTCCPKYAELNVDRKVPLRQYFGEENRSNHLPNSPMKRKVYGTGTGVSTVGGDIKTTSTSPLTSVMKQIISILNGMNLCQGKYCSSSAKFNHVTILYYMVDSHTTPVVNLNKHCDIVVSPSNNVSKNNSQKATTPTVVLTLQSSKHLDLYKRYTDGNHFLPATKQDSMQLNHGDIFVNHPRDERCIRRKILCPGTTTSFSKETLASQFQHGVSFKVNRRRDADLQHRIYNVSISVCFRQVLPEQEFSDSNFHTSKISSENLTDTNMSTAKIHKSKLIHKKRKSITNPYVRNRVRKKMKKFYNKVHR